MKPAVAEVEPAITCRDARQRLGLSIAAFSRLIGVNEYTVWRWENKKSPVSPFYTGVLRALAVVAAQDPVQAAGIVNNPADKDEPDRALRALVHLLALFYGFCPITKSGAYAQK